MKRALLFCILMSYVFVGFCQGTDDITKVLPIKKGMITLTNRTTFSYRNLTVVNDTVILTNSQSKVCKYYSGDISKISKTRNSAAIYAISGGVGACIGGILGTGDWGNYEELKDLRGTYIICATLSGAAIGALVGSFIKYSKPVYTKKAGIKKPLAYRFGMGYNNIAENKPVMMLTCKITF